MSGGASASAEWPVTPNTPSGGAWPPPNSSFVANDNVTAGQLQGHTGKIIECDTCHTGSFSAITGQANWLNGPHNLHPVGSASGTNYSQWWVDNHPTVTLSQGNAVSCGTCHVNPFVPPGPAAVVAAP